MLSFQRLISSVSSQLSSPPMRLIICIHATLIHIKLFFIIYYSFWCFFFFFFRWRKTHQLMLFSQIYALQLQLHQLIFQPTVSKPRMQRAVLWGNSILLMEAWLPIILYDHLMKFDLQHQRFVYIDVSGWFFWFCLISRL